MSGMGGKHPELPGPVVEPLDADGSHDPTIRNARAKAGER
jgi:hypothetical protein